MGVLGYSTYTVLGKRVAKRYDAISMTAFSTVASAILLLPLAIRQGVRLDWSGVGWAGLLYMAALSSAAGYMLFYWLLRYMDASRVVVNYLQPVIVVLLSIPLLGERPSRRLLLSGGLVLLASIWLSERRGPKSKLSARNLEVKKKAALFAAPPSMPIASNMSRYFGGAGAVISESI